MVTGIEKIKTNRYNGVKQIMIGSEEAKNVKTTGGHTVI